MTSYLNLTIAGIVLAVIQLVAALPWLWALDPVNFKRWFRNAQVVGYSAGGLVLAGAGMAFFMAQGSDAPRLQFYGRCYGAILHIQLAVDFFILVPQFLLVVWPKGGSVALATFREGIRQPMFWLIAGLAGVLILLSMVIPYFTFGEDYKMMKQLGFDVVMLSAGLFGLLAASISIYEEIEGRTAITVMSKPINRRQFLIGKYVGSLLACWAMTVLLGWLLTWALYIKSTGFFDKLDDIADTMSTSVQEVIRPALIGVVPTPEGAAISVGGGSWFGDTIAHHIGLLLNFGQVMILLAICTALATRMTFVINLVICLVVFMLGHLAPTLVQVTDQLARDGSSPMLLVNFIAQLFNAVFPAFEYFDMGPAIMRDNAVDMGLFTKYVATVFGYTVLYTAIALIGGLLLFEDRDLA